MAGAIHVVPDDNFDDWVVRDYKKHEFGHYPPEKPPNPSPRRSPESAGTNSSFTSLTEERAARGLKWGGWLDCSGDDQTHRHRRPAALSCRRHARGSTPAIEAAA
jgi:hypothetical protein